MTTIALPRINLNGTSKGELLQQQLTALDAINAAIDALCAAAPNGRDYQTLPSGAVQLAMSEHTTRLKLLQTVQDELQTIAMHISDQEGR